MDTADYKDLEIEPESEVQRRLRWGWWILIIVGVLVLIMVPLAWMLRTSLAERALAQWCQSRDLVCEGRITRLGSDGGELENLVVRSGSGTPVEAKRVRAGLEWDGFDFSITEIVITEPVLRGTLDDDGLRFYGLEQLDGGGDGGTGSLPALTITDGRILLATSAGEIGASAALQVCSRVCARPTPPLSSSRPARSTTRSRRSPPSTRGCSGSSTSTWRSSPS